MHYIGIDPSDRSCGIWGFGGAIHGQFRITQAYRYLELLKEHIEINDISPLDCVFAIETFNNTFMFKSCLSASNAIVRDIHELFDAGRGKKAIVMKMRPQDWRKYIFGSTRTIKDGSPAWKEMAIAHAMDNTGILLMEDEAEAFCIAKAAEIKRSVALV